MVAWGERVITENNYLDLGNLLINELIGSVPLTIIIGLAVLIWWGVRERLDIQAIFALCILWVGLVTAYAYNQFALMIVLFLVGLTVYGTWAKIIKR